MPRTLTGTAARGGATATGTAPIDVADTTGGHDYDVSLAIDGTTLQVNTEGQLAVASTLTGTISGDVPIDVQLASGHYTVSLETDGTLRVPFLSSELSVNTAALVDGMTLTVTGNIATVATNQIVDGSTLTVTGNKAAVATAQIVDGTTLTAASNNKASVNIGAIVDGSTVVAAAGKIAGNYHTSDPHLTITGSTISTNDVASAATLSTVEGDVAALDASVTAIDATLYMPFTGLVTVVPAIGAAAAAAAAAAAGANTNANGRQLADPQLDNLTANPGFFDTTTRGNQFTVKDTTLTTSRNELVVLQPALGTGNTTGIVVGTATTTDNAATLAFTNVGGTGSASNVAKVGLAGASPLTIDGSGNVVAPAAFTVAGGDIVATAGQVRAAPTSGDAYLRGQVTNGVNWSIVQLDNTGKSFNIILKPSGETDLSLSAGSTLLVNSPVTFNSSGPIVWSTAPTAGSHLANKAYVDGAVATAGGSFQPLHAQLTSLSSNTAPTVNATAGPLLLSSTGTGSIDLLEAYEPSLATSAFTRLSTGVALTTNNSAAVRFTNVGGAGSATNTVDLGLLNGPKLTIDGNGQFLVPGNLTNLLIQSLAGTSSTSPIQSYVPSLATGNLARFLIGAASSTNNAADLRFTNVGGSGSALNRAALGLAGASQVTIDGSGNTVVPGTLTVTGTATAAAPTLGTHLATKTYVDGAITTSGGAYQPLNAQLTSLSGTQPTLDVTGFNKDLALRSTGTVNNNMLTAFTSSLSTGAYSGLVVGTADTTWNAAYLRFNNVGGTGSVTNTVSIGTSVNVVTVDGNGALVIPSTVTATGTIQSTGGDVVSSRNADSIVRSEVTNGTNYAYFVLKNVNTGTSGSVYMKPVGEVHLSAQSGQSIVADNALSVKAVTASDAVTINKPGSLGNVGLLNMTANGSDSVQFGISNTNVSFASYAFGVGGTASGSGFPNGGLFIYQGLTNTYPMGITAAGNAVFAGTVSGANAVFTGTVSGAAPTAAAHLTTKTYVDSQTNHPTILNVLMSALDPTLLPSTQSNLCHFTRTTATTLIITIVWHFYVNVAGSTNAPVLLYNGTTLTTTGTTQQVHYNGDAGGNANHERTVTYLETNNATPPGFYGIAVGPATGTWWAYNSDDYAIVRIEQY